MTYVHKCSGHLHTEPPSPPRSVSLTPQQSSITVRWSAPSDNGGRTDLYYEVDISDPDNLGSYTGTVYLSGRSTSRTISGLRPFTQYCVRVTAHNGVSDQDPNGQHLRREEQCTRTLTAGTYIIVYNILQQQNFTHLLTFCLSFLHGQTNFLSPSLYCFSLYLKLTQYLYNYTM